jgi:hypothetical protein
MCLVGEPDAVVPPVRFDEREVETEYGVRYLATKGKLGYQEIPPPNLSRHLSTLLTITGEGRR